MINRYRVSLLLQQPLLVLPSSDLKSLQKSEGRFGISGGPRGDNLFVWDVELGEFEKGTLLYKDLQSYAHTYKRKVCDGTIFSTVYMCRCSTIMSAYEGC